MESFVSPLMSFIFRIEVSSMPKESSMENIVSFLMSLLFGIMTSFIAWIIVTHIIKPSIQILEISREKSSDKTGETICKVEVKNCNWYCLVYDINLYGRILVTESNYTRTYLVKVGDGGSPYINAGSTKKYTLSIYQHGKVRDMYQHYSGDNSSKRIDIIDILNLKKIQSNQQTTFELEIALICTHKFSGARNIATKKFQFDSKDITIYPDDYLL